MSGAELARTHASVDAYYSSKVESFGATPGGVDWTCSATQNLRFVQLLRICDFSADLSLNDVGCGYGALLAFCRERHPDRAIDYVGVDLSAAMVRVAQQHWQAAPGVRFVVGASCPRTADFAIASGLFNVCQSIATEEWESFVRATLRELGFRNVKALYIVKDLGTDWIDKGYPVTRGG